MLEELLVNTPKYGEFGHARTLESTYEWVKPALKKVPITRVYDITPLDSLGVPVWGAVTPLANDLMVHAGKGINHAASRLSAIMEGIERVCAENISINKINKLSYTSAKETSMTHYVDPEYFSLPFETEYSPSKIISWVAGYDLIQKREVYVPLDIVISPAQEGLCFGVETNGIASGNTYTEAILHGVFELIERDAVSHDYFSELYSNHSDRHAADVTMIDLSTLPDSVKSLISGFQSSDIEVAVQKLNSSTGIPVYSTIIWDSNFPLYPGYPVAFGGQGCDINPERALLRSVTEACQSHSVVLLGARDDFEGRISVPDSANRLRRILDQRYPENYKSFDDKNLESDDILVDINYTMNALSSAGFGSCIVVDLSKVDLGVPVVRVLIPGFSHPYGFTRKKPTDLLLKSLV